MNNELETPVGWHRHPNGGGLVQDTATVADTAYVGPNAKVSDFAIVLDSAMVRDFARVRDFAMVRDFARVQASAVVSGNAWLYGNAHVSRDARLTITPIYIQGSKHWIGYAGNYGQIRSGCIEKPVAWWRSEAAIIRASEEGYTEVQQEEYRLHVKHVAAWMKLYDAELKAACEKGSEDEQ
jgi:acyl-[acyl carrier protein]--UDP-N-acetylglucosamine O-acyltransferase